MFFLSAAWRFLKSLPGWVYTACAIFLSFVLLGRVSRLKRLLNATKQVRESHEERQDAEADVSADQEDAQAAVDKEEQSAKAAAKTDTERIALEAPELLVEDINDAFGSDP